MRYLLVLVLLAGCATPEKMRTAYDEELCDMNELLMGRETRHAYILELKRRGMESCRGPVGNPYPSGAVLVTQ
jgi:hypothetical protein